MYTSFILWRMSSLILVLGMAKSYWCSDLDLKVITVSTEVATNAYARFIRSVRMNDLDVEAHAGHPHTTSTEGDSPTHIAGDFYKIDMLRSALEKYKHEESLILMITDSHNVIFTSGKTEILDKFRQFEAKLVVAAVDFCHPDRSLRPQYPALTHDGYKYVSANGIIGYAPAVYELITSNLVTHTDDYQLYFTHMYLKFKDRYNITLDHSAKIFQNLNGNRYHIDLDHEHEGSIRVVNTRFKTKPVMVFGTGPNSMLHLNYLGNYVAKSWTHEDGCISCREDKIVLSHIERKEWPRILIGIFISTPTPFLDSFLTQISSLDYPKNRIDIFLHNAVTNHITDVEQWIGRINDKYTSLTYKKSDVSRQDGKHMGLSHCKKVKCEYYFSIDSSVTISNDKTLQILVEQNRTLLAPMVSKPGLLFSNFWGDINADGFYKRSLDYLDIVKHHRQGVWNCPYVSHVYLVKAQTIDRIGINPYRNKKDGDIDIGFCSNLRRKEIFMYVTNMEYFGHLKEMDAFTDHHKHNDLYQLFENPLDWEDKYLHPKYMSYMTPTSIVPQPCPDVYWIPLTSEKFAQDLIDECEYYGQWSGGRHEDVRLAGGYENVPTVDIHMKQIGFDQHWLHILKKYVIPYVNMVYNGFKTRGIARLNFVVKYEPSGQFYLRPHHDESTYTVNMALNKVGVDYMGGGPRFIRYNCSVTDTRVGWALLHPGRLTHQHEGLSITKGVRYVMISFVDPEG